MAELLLWLWNNKYISDVNLLTFGKRINSVPVQKFNILYACGESWLREGNDYRNISTMRIQYFFVFFQFLYRVLWFIVFGYPHARISGSNIINGSVVREIRRAKLKKPILNLHKIFTAQHSRTNTHTRAHTAPAHFLKLNVDSIHACSSLQINVLTIEMK